MPHSHALGPTRAAPHRPAPTAGPLARVVTLTGRCVRLSARNLDALLMSLALPVLLMLVFVYLFGGAITTGDPATSYVTYVVPGVLVLCSGYGAALTASTLNGDLRSGVVDRFRSMDVGGTALVGGHVLASLARNAAATAAVLLVALLLGFRPRASLGAALAAAVVLLCYVLALSWLAAVVGALVSTPEAAGAFGFVALFLPYPSSAFVPVETMPGWLHGFAGHQPVTSVIESLRALLLGAPAGASPWIALAWCAVLLALSVPLASLALARRHR
ncbi:ABC transporter permease [Streptomyces durbertensis]|uniref:Transport permease protein n=1 Tax=Streptomyces durbertensis TaxID=2448886 RepID=A0ABR6EE09_9ACTN|nr:ABC transporter permease [Streptomyces durbertensis]MBB1243403.1 ABC transporter permease [Streptomyces durbertensis]